MKDHVAIAKPPRGKGPRTKKQIRAVKARAEIEQQVQAENARVRQVSGEAA